MKKWLLLFVFCSCNIVFADPILDRKIDPAALSELALAFGISKAVIKTNLPKNFLFDVVGEVLIPQAIQLQLPSPLIALPAGSMKKNIYTPKQLGKFGSERAKAQIRILHVVWV